MVADYKYDKWWHLLSHQEKAEVINLFYSFKSMVHKTRAAFDKPSWLLEKRTRHIKSEAEVT